MKPKTISCGTAAVRSGSKGSEVLLVQPRANQDRWGLPKGHVDEGESFEDAAVRETLEETGILVDLIPITLGTAHVKLKNEDKTIIIYMAVPRDDKSEPEPRDDENYRVAWWSIDALPPIMQSQKNMFEALPTVVKRILKT
jgi:ADP-ribose pyrophosphatase YjhB (NUDIX family)